MDTDLDPRVQEKVARRVQEELSGLERLRFFDNEQQKAEFAAELTLRAIVDAKQEVDKESFERLQMLGERLKVQFMKQVAEKQPVEDRWIEDIRQYHGRYDPQTELGIKNSGGSRVFTNITRPKTNTFSARLADMLIPTDDQNWGIQPTPIPEATQAMKSDKPIQVEGQDLKTEQGSVVQERDIAKGIDEAVRKACDQMAEQMSDQLAECLYNAVQRDLIEDMCIFGNGVLKGPHVIGQFRKAWVRAPGGYVMQMEQVMKPTAMRVSPWDFFPDVSSMQLRDCEFIFERHYMTRKQVRGLLKTPGFNKLAVEEVLKSQRPGVTTPHHILRLREISVDMASSMWDENRFEVIEYHGPIEKEDLVAAGAKFTDSQMEDPTFVPDGIVWFCDNVVLKAVLNPMENEERPYSIGYLYKDDTSIFGFGLPYMLRSSQRVINAVSRMINDNGGLAAGGNLVLDRTKVQPSNGEWAIQPKKIWDLLEDVQSIEQVFKLVEFPGHLQDLMAIFNLFYKLADDEINLPLITQGSQASYMTKTAEGMGMLMNSANVVLRRAVKSYDDDITIPFLTRLYDWNMQFSPDDSIKGDFNVVAKGSSVLMEREQQVRTLMNSMHLIDRPDLSIWINDEKLGKTLMKNMRLTEVMNTPQEAEDKRKRLEAAAQEQSKTGQQSEEMEVFKLRLKAAEIKQRGEMHNNDISMRLKHMADTLKMKEEDLRTRLNLKIIDTDKEIQMFNAELATKHRYGEGI